MINRYVAISNQVKIAWVFLFLFVLMGGVLLPKLELQAQTSPPSQTSLSGVSLEQYQQTQEAKRVQKRRVREKNYPGARLEGELTVQPDIKTNKEKRKLEKEER